MARKELLFITPVLPSTRGRGRNYRAFQWVNRLSKSYNVSVLCTSVYGDYPFQDDKVVNRLDCKIFEWRHKHSLIQRFTNLLLLRPSKWNVTGKELDIFDIPDPDIILCFRLHNAPVALKARDIWQQSELWLDLDELDSHTKSGITRLMYSKGYFLEAGKSRLDSFLYSFREKRSLGLFDRIFTSTKAEKLRVQKQFGLKNVDVYDNMLPLNKRYIPVPVQQKPFQFLFVGDSNYFPNLDAIDFIIYRLIPTLSGLVNVPFRFVIIGGKIGKKQLRQVHKYSSIEFIQDVDNLEEVYRRTNAVVVPLRAGGGSSLKFLEGLRYGKPVVASAVGARGFNVNNGEHVLIGNGAGEIAQHCRSLIENPELVQMLAENGHQWFLNHNSYLIGKEHLEKYPHPPVAFAKYSPVE